MVTAPDLYRWVRSRRSIRRYTNEPVAPEVIERLLTAATWAPSAHNRQPWRFAVVTNDAARRRLAQAMGDRLRRDRLADGDSPDAIEADVARSFARITGAPVLIAVCLSMEAMDRYPDETRSTAEFLMAVQSTAMAVQNLLLAAHAEGLGACWMCAPLFCEDTVREALELPGGWRPQALVTMGHPASAGKPASRRGLGEVAVWK